MAATYTKIDRVGSFDAGFQQVPLVQNIQKFHSASSSDLKGQMTCNLVGTSVI